MVFLSVQDHPLEDGTWVSGSVSVRTPAIPRQKGYVRAFQDSVAFYTPLDDNTKTALTIVCRIDLNDSSQDGEGGFIPMWLYVKTIGVTAAASVIRMRDALVQDQQERQQRQLQLKEARDAEASSHRPWWRNTQVFQRGLSPQSPKHQP